MSFNNDLPPRHIEVRRMDGSVERFESARAWLDAQPVDPRFIPRKVRGQPMPTPLRMDRNAFVAHAYASGEPVSAIAELVQIPAYRVSRIAKEEGAESRPIGRPPLDPAAPKVLPCPPKPRRMTPKQENRRDRDDRIGKAYLDGVMVADIAERFGMTMAAVNLIVRRDGLPNRIVSRDPADVCAREAKIVAMLRKGMSSQMVADLMGLNVQHVRKVANHDGLIGMAMTAARNAKIAEAYDRGDSVDRIAQRFGINSNNYVVQLAKKGGAKPRPKGRKFMGKDKQK